LNPDDESKFQEELQKAKEEIEAELKQIGEEAKRKEAEKMLDFKIDFDNDLTDLEDRIRDWELSEGDDPEVKMKAMKLLRKDLGELRNRLHSLD